MPLLYVYLNVGNIDDSSHLLLYLEIQLLLYFWDFFIVASSNAASFWGLYLIGFYFLFAKVNVLPLGNYKHYIFCGVLLKSNYDLAKAMKMFPTPFTYSISILTYTTGR